MRPLRDWLSKPVLLGALAVLVLAAVIVVFPALLVRPAGKITAAERLKAENDVRTTLVQVLGGAVLLTGLYFTARTLGLNALSLEVTRTREGQITERFTRAIDQLGPHPMNSRSLPDSPSAAPAGCQWRWIRVDRRRNPRAVDGDRPDKTLGTDSGHLMNDRG